MHMALSDCLQVVVAESYSSAQSLRSCDSGHHYLTLRKELSSLGLGGSTGAYLPVLSQARPVTEIQP